MPVNTYGGQNFSSRRRREGGIEQARSCDAYLFQRRAAEVAHAQVEAALALADVGEARLGPDRVAAVLAEARIFQLDDDADAWEVVAARVAFEDFQRAI